MTEITQELAKKVLELVDCGLTAGLGAQKPGQMCIEAVVCYALGLPHGDDPGCVAPPLRTLKIDLNDSNWSSNRARANGLRRLALAQLGSAGHLDEREFARRLADYAVRVSTSQALRSAAGVIKSPEHKSALLATAEEARKAAYAAAAVDAYAASHDKSLADYAEAVIQILIEMKVPGCRWLYLTEDAA